MKYFLPPYTINGINKQYRENAKLLHPDKLGNEKHFIEMQKEKETILKAIAKVNNLFPEKKKAVKKKKTVKKYAPKKKPVYKYLHLHLDVNEFFDLVIKNIM